MDYSCELEWFICNNYFMFLIIRRKTPFFRNSRILTFAIRSIERKTTQSETIKFHTTKCWVSESCPFIQLPTYSTCFIWKTTNHAKSISWIKHDHGNVNSATYYHAHISDEWTNKHATDRQRKCYKVALETWLWCFWKTCTYYDRISMHLFMNTRQNEIISPLMCVILY